MANSPTYYDSIQKHHQAIQEALISEAPHTSFRNIPPEFSFFQGKTIDLGFESLGLDERSYKELMLGFVKTGIRIPGTNYKIRADNTLKSVFEPTTPQENIPTLPVNWMDTVLMMGKGNEVMYAGDIAKTYHNLKVTG